MSITVKQVSEESFGSVALYLDYILAITKELGVPYYITLDDTKYLVTRVQGEKGNTYACAYEKDGKIKAYGISLPDKNNNIGQVSITDGVSIIRDFSNVPGSHFVIKENVINDNQEQLMIGQDRDGTASLIYYQTDVNRNMDCEISYSIKGFEERLSSYLDYIDAKFPKSIIIGEDKKLFKVINHRTTETYRFDDYLYLIPTLKIFGIEFASVTSAVDRDDVLYNVRTNGFNSSIPRVLSDTLTHRNKVENNMKILAKVYDENCMKMN